MRAQDWLRQWTMMVATGADFIEVEPMLAFAQDCALSADDKTLFPSSVSLNDCDINDKPGYQANVDALKTFQNWLANAAIIAPKTVNDLKSLNAVALQIDDPFWPEFVSIQMANKRPAAGTCFSTQQLSGKPVWVQAAIPSSCKEGSTCSPNVCSAKLDETGDHLPAVINDFPGTANQRARPVDAVDLFGRIYGNSFGYDGLFPSLPMGIVPILGVGDIPNRRAAIPFSGADAAVCGATNNQKCNLQNGTSPVSTASDKLLARISQSANSVAMPAVIKGGGGTLVKAGENRYVITAWDNEQRFPSGVASTVQINDANLFAWRLSDAVSDSSGIISATTGTWKVVNDKPYRELTSAGHSFSIKPAGTRVLNLQPPGVDTLLPVAPSVLIAQGGNPGSYFSPGCSWIYISTTSAGNLYHLVCSGALVAKKTPRGQGIPSIITAESGYETVPAGQAYDNNWQVIKSVWTANACKSTGKVKGIYSSPSAATSALASDTVKCGTGCNSTYVQGSGGTFATICR